MQTLPRLALLAALSCGTSLATALPAAAQDDEIIDLGEIVVSALRTAVERLRTGVSVTVLGPDELAKDRDATVASTLAKLPGVAVTQSGPFGSTTNLRIRGADDRYLAVFVDGIKHIKEVEIVARQVPGPKVVSIVDGNETTALTAKALEEMGFAVVLYAVTALFSAARAMADALATLKRDGTPAAAAGAMMTYGDFSTLVDLPRFQKLDEDYG